MTRLIGLDVGDVRTGIAVSDELGLTARPLRTVPTAKLATELAALLAEHGVDTVVVGRPRHLDGGLGEQADKVRHVIDGLAKLSAAFVYEDETGTTAAAPDGSDEQAACVILQGYLDENAHS